MNDERKQEMREILEAMLCAIDRIAALEPKPPLEGREERVEEIRKMLCDAAEKSPRGVFYYRGMAEQIVATEPRAMSREEMVGVAAARLRKKDLTRTASDLEAQYMSHPTHCILIAIDAFAGKTSASDNEVEEWKEKYRRSVEHRRRLEATCAKKSGKINDLEQEVTKLKWHTPAETPDRLDRICRLLRKIPTGLNELSAYMQIENDGSGVVEREAAQPPLWLCDFDSNQNPEQVIAEYLAGLDKPSNLQCELDGLDDRCLELRKLAEKELAKTE